MLFIANNNNKILTPILTIFLIIYKTYFLVLILTTQATRILRVCRYTVNVTRHLVCYLVTAAKLLDSPKIRPSPCQKARNIALNTLLKAPSSCMFKSGRSFSYTKDK